MRLKRKFTRIDGSSNRDEDDAQEKDVMKTLHVDQLMTKSSVETIFIAVFFMENERDDLFRNRGLTLG